MVADSDSDVLNRGVMEISIQELEEFEEEMINKEDS